MKTPPEDIRSLSRSRLTLQMLQDPSVIIRLSEAIIRPHVVSTLYWLNCKPLRPSAGSLQRWDWRSRAR